MTDAIKKRIEALEKKYGKSTDGAVITGDAFHACNPEMEYGWKAPAVMVNSDGTVSGGFVWWDFESYHDANPGIVVDDAGMYPWDGQSEFEIEVQELDLDDDYDLDQWM